MADGYAKRRSRYFFDRYTNAGIYTGMRDGVRTDVDPYYLICSLSREQIDLIDMIAEENSIIDEQQRLDDRQKAGRVCFHYGNPWRWKY